jgi:hypothetical protein
MSRTPIFRGMQNENLPSSEGYSYMIDIGTLYDNLKHVLEMEISTVDF